MPNSYHSQINHGLLEQEMKSEDALSHLQEPADTQINLNTFIICLIASFTIVAACAALLGTVIFFVCKTVGVL